jgi:hypothetical protein
MQPGFFVGFTDRRLSEGLARVYVTAEQIPDLKIAALAQQHTIILNNRSAGDQAGHA